MAELFNPRAHIWTDHFRLEGGLIIALSPTGRATERLLKLNLEPDGRAMAWPEQFQTEAVMND